MKYGILLLTLLGLPVQAETMLSVLNKSNGQAVYYQEFVYNRDCRIVRTILLDVMKVTHGDPVYVICNPVRISGS